MNANTAKLCIASVKRKKGQMINKWKRRYEKLLEASQCRHVWAYLEIDRETSQVYIKYEHTCGDDCAFLRAVRGE